MYEIVTKAGMIDAGNDQGRVAKKYFFIKMIKNRLQSYEII